MAELALKQLLKAVGNLPKTGEFSDLTVISQDGNYKVHKAILCTRSAFFAKAMKFPGKESAESQVDLSEEDPVVIGLLMQYFYTAEYRSNLPVFESDGNSSKQCKIHSCDLNNCASDYYKRRVCAHHHCGDDCELKCSNFICDRCVPMKIDAKELIIHAQMYEIADKYGVVGLKELAKVKFHVACNRFWDDQEFSIAAHHAYVSTPDEDKGLRSVVCKIISQHMSLIKKPEIEALMTEFNGLSFGLLMEKATQHGWC